jgi:hypothetical protein
MALVTSSLTISSMACAVSSSMFQPATLRRTWARALAVASGPGLNCQVPAWPGGKVRVRAR